MEIPKKISPNSIIEAVLEIRFENELPSAVVFGKLYGALSEKFGRTEQMPVLQIPEELRKTQPNLKYTPHYRLWNDKYLINIGQNMISVNRVVNNKEYEGWEEYLKTIKIVLKEVKNAELIKEAEKIYVRYINFFDESIDEVLDLKLKLFKEEINDYENLNLSYTKKIDEDKKLNITINSKKKVESEVFNGEGLVVKLEAQKDTNTAAAKLNEVVEDLHNLAKEGFFKSLDDKFLKSLNPIYE